MKEQAKRVWSTVFTAFTLVFFYFIAGAVVVTQNLEGSRAYFVQGCFIWIAALIMIITSLLKSHSLQGIGFKKLKKGSVRDAYYYIPLLAIALSGLVGGIDFTKGLPLIISSLFVTVAVGFSEEIYCRGIICRNWNTKSPLAAIIVSSVVFGLCHLVNICGGASVGATLLQVVFAFFYGIVMAIIYLRSGSIIPCIMIHFLHDFCSFISVDINPSYEIYVNIFQAVIIVVYAVLLLVEYLKKDEEE